MKAPAFCLGLPTACPSTSLLVVFFLTPIFFPIPFLLSPSILNPQGQARPIARSLSLYTSMFFSFFAPCPQLVCCVIISSSDQFICPERVSAQSSLVSLRQPPPSHFFLPPDAIHPWSILIIALVCLPPSLIPNVVCLPFSRIPRWLRYIPAPLSYTPETIH
jgi:hypothetical protein